MAECEYCDGEEFLDAGTEALLLNEWNRRSRANRERDVLANHGIWLPNVGSPASHIGAALELADHYGVKLRKGTCFGDVCATLYQDKWAYAMDWHISPFDYGVWYMTQPILQTGIQGFGHSVQEAVCKCLVNAKKAKVI